MCRAGASWKNKLDLYFFACVKAHSAVPVDQLCTD